MKVRYKAIITVEVEEEVDRENLIDNPKETMDNDIREILGFNNKANINIESTYEEEE